MRAVLTAREQVELLSPWRIATTSWDDQIEHSGSEHGGMYWIPRLLKDPKWPTPIGELYYGHRTDEDENPYLYVRHLDTHPDYQLQGVATSLLQRMVKDHPGHKIDPGTGDLLADLAEAQGVGRAGEDQQ